MSLFKKIPFLALFIGFGMVFGASVFLSPHIASAATAFSFSPLKISVHAGQTFTVNVRVNPKGTKNYTVKADIKFPADLVSVTKWQFGEDWMGLSQSGYSLMDNAGGELIRTAGYPDGFSGLTTFGTATFTAKKDGTGVIEFTGGSIALDANNANVYAGGDPLYLLVSSLTATSTATSTPVTTTTTPVIVTSTIPQQLFDINLEVDSSDVATSSGLPTRVTFTSFGSVPTPVQMTFDVLDANGNVVYTKIVSTTVETQSVYTPTFADMNLKPGTYVLRLRTLYNQTVADEFRQSFTVTGGASNGWPLWKVGIIIYSIAAFLIVLIFIFFLLKRRRKDKDEDEKNKESKSANE